MNSINHRCKWTLLSHKCQLLFNILNKSQRSYHIRQDFCLISSSMLPPAIAKTYALEEKQFLWGTQSASSWTTTHLWKSFHKQSLIPLGELCNCNTLKGKYSAATYSLPSVQVVWSFCTLWMEQTNSKRAVANCIAKKLKLHWNKQYLEQNSWISSFLTELYYFYSAQQALADMKHKHC